MDDVVGEVLTQRKALDRGAGVGVALSLLLHGMITGAAVLAALRHTPEQSVSVIEIKLAKMPAPPQPVPQSVAQPAPPTPQPVVKPAPPKSVPLSNFGKSTKKGAEQPSVPAPQQPAVEIP